MGRITSILFYVTVFILTMDCDDSKVRKKFGCIIPKEPIYGGFIFNITLKTLEIVCQEGYQLTDTPKYWQCWRGKWKGYWSHQSTKMLDFQNNCTSPFSSIKDCPPLHAPRNGIVITPSRAVGGKATFFCDEGYVIIGSEERICYPDNIWSGKQPVCRRLKTAGDMADLLQDQILSKLSLTTATSKYGVQSKPTVSKSGLDIVFALDVSASIGQKSLEIAQKFMKLLVKTFGISHEKDGGEGGTRIAFLTFSSKANMVFNLNDETVRTEKAVFDKIDSIKNTAGGTNFLKLVVQIYFRIYTVIDREKDRKRDATRAIFILTDAEASFGMYDHRNLNYITNLLKKKGFEIFGIGVGHTDTNKLSNIASEPLEEHVFVIKEMAVLERMEKIISEENLDHGQCGITALSSNAKIADDGGYAKKDAWPWVGWVNVYDEESPKTCGGYLVCQRYFATTASCVTKDTADGNITVVDKSKILVTLGDQNLYGPDPDEVQVRVSNIHLHPSYTGEANIYNVKDYDIAVLDFGQDKNKLPVFNKHIRPICMAARLNSSVYAFSVSRRLNIQQKWQNIFERGFVAGWGHKIEPSFDLPTDALTQLKRTVQPNKRCEKRYPELDTTKFFCVGNVHEVSGCKFSDIGGPYMDEMNENKQYAVLGMALDTKDCEEWHRFSIFLNTLRPDIVTWLGGFLSECNRVEEIIPTTALPPQE